MDENDSSHHRAPPRPPSSSTPWAVVLGFGTLLLTAFVALATRELSGLAIALAAVSVLAVGGAGTAAAAFGWRWSGVGVVVLAGVLASCIASGVAITGFVEDIASGETGLDPVFVAGEVRYLRHPEIGFLLPALDDSWFPMSALGRMTGVGFSRLGSVDGGWTWVEHGTSDQVIVTSLTFNQEPDETQVRRAVLHFAHGVGMMTAMREDPARFARWDGPLRETWIHTTAGDTETTARVVAWREEATGDWRGVVVAGVSHVPNRSWLSWLLDVHAPSSPWLGPGLAPPGFATPTTSLTEARAAFASTHPNAPSATPGLPVETEEIDPAFERIVYATPSGEREAFLARGASDGAAKPAVLFLHGDYSIDGQLEEGWIPSALVGAGFVVLAPSMRGEDENGSTAEHFLGEDAEARAALDRLRAEPGVDAARVFVIGHDMGATIALLLAESGAPARGFVALSPLADVLGTAIPPTDEERSFYYEGRDAEETFVRSPIHFVASITAPTLVITGDGGDGLEGFDVQLLGAAAPAGSPLRAHVLPSVDDLAIALPLIAQLAPRMREGSIELGEAELAAIGAEALREWNAGSLDESEMVDALTGEAAAEAAANAPEENAPEDDEGPAPAP